jgi:DUF1680 family protein
MTTRPVPLPRRDVALASSTFALRQAASRNYLVSLTSDNLLQNHRFEAGLWNPPYQPKDIHWGWESPTSPVRGHFLGHWLSAAAHHDAAHPDPQLRGQADFVVAELAKCQEANGGEWVASIPEKYLRWVAGGRFVWAPGYVAGKTLMGLHDMYAVGGNEQALDVLVNAASWYHRFTGELTTEQMADFLDYEQCGMLETFADLYGITREQSHLDLVGRYDRSRFFDALVRGDDVLTNQHANTTIPEVIGAARAYEVTGDTRWREIVEAYWRMAVTERGTFATGGQTSGEVWTPPHELGARLGQTTQEFCTVYNMMRLAEFLFRWSGDTAYLDYRERNLYNGVLAQQHPHTGMVAYYLPFLGGSTKKWSTPTESFPCCLGTMVQAMSQLGSHSVYTDDSTLMLAQPLPATIEWRDPDVHLAVRTSDSIAPPARSAPEPDPSAHRPQQRHVEVTVTAARPSAFTLALRIPDWMTGPATLTVDGDRTEIGDKPGWHSVERTWTDNVVRLELPASPVTIALPDRPDTVAFAVGPVVLGGQVDGDRTLVGDPADAQTMIEPSDERAWAAWTGYHHTRNQPEDFQLLPLGDILEDPFAVYFPVRQA